jgi:hypothetical protein
MTTYTHQERQRLVAEIDRLQQEAQAESDFAAAFPGDDNPWTGSTERFEAAKTTLASLDEVERLNRFRNLVNRYREDLETLHGGRLQDELKEVQERQNALGGHRLLAMGVLHRPGNPVSERDADERARARQIKDMEGDRMRIGSQIDAIIVRMRKAETDNPFLRTYQAYLQAASQKSSAA